MCGYVSISITDFNLYSEFIDIDSLSVEIKLWKRKWITHSQNDHRQSTAIDSLRCCNSNLFPGIHILFKVLAALPVSTVSTPERSFPILETCEINFEECY